MGGAGQILVDEWPKEVLTVLKRNGVFPRRWGMQVTVTNDPTPANNTTWVLAYGLNSTDKNDNLNWQTLAAYAGGGGGGGAAAVNALDAVVVNAGNVNAAETIVYAYTILPTILTTNKQSILGKSAGTFQPGTDAYIIRGYLNGTPFFDSGDIQLFDASDWVLEYTITRVDANTQKISCSLITSIGGNTFVGNAILTEDLTANVDLEVTVQGATTNQIVCTNTKLFKEGI